MQRTTHTNVLVAAPYKRNAMQQHCTGDNDADGERGRRIVVGRGQPIMSRALLSTRANGSKGHIRKLFFLSSSDLH
eukprot:7528338-Pyramimonas_sp.AAC.1